MRNLATYSQRLNSEARFGCFLVHMNLCILSFLDPFSFPFTLLRYSTVISSISEDRSFHQQLIQHILTNPNRVTGKKHITFGEKDFPHLFFTYSTTLRTIIKFVPFLERKPAKSTISKNKAKGKKKRARIKIEIESKKSKFCLLRKR